MHGWAAAECWEHRFMSWTASRKPGSVHPGTPTRQHLLIQEAHTLSPDGQLDGRRAFVTVGLRVERGTNNFRREYCTARRPWECLGQLGHNVVAATKERRPSGGGGGHLHSPAARAPVSPTCCSGCGPAGALLPPPKGHDIAAWRRADFSRAAARGRQRGWRCPKGT